MYTCRAANGRIQEDVRWTPDPDEFVAVKTLKIEVQLPAYHEQRGTWTTLMARGSDEGEPLGSQPIRCSLKDYLHIDQLLVRMEVNYVVDADQLLSWTMAHPTRNFDFYVNYPETVTVHVKPLVLHPELCHVSVHETYARVRYDSWMLPQSGVAYRIWPRGA